MTYQDMYLTFLEEQTQKGGTEEKVEKIFAEYNNPTPEGFAKWASVVPFVNCETCGCAFKATTVQPTQEITCPACTES